MHVLGVKEFKFIIFNDGDSNNQEPNYKLVIIYKFICSENTGISKSLGSNKDYGQLGRREDERKSAKHHVYILKEAELGYFPLRSRQKIIDLSPVNWSLSSCKDRSNSGQNGGRRWPVSPEYEVMQEKLPLSQGLWSTQVFTGLDEGHLRQGTSSVNLIQQVPHGHSQGILISVHPSLVKMCKLSHLWHVGPVQGKQAPSLSMTHVRISFAVGTFNLLFSSLLFPCEGDAMGYLFIDLIR